MTDFTVCTATELTDLYRTGSASPVTVAEQVLAKIERLNPVINAFCFTDPDTTLAQARASADRWQQNTPLSKLDGVPVAVKDSILTQGWPTLQGSATIDPAQDWLENAPATARLRESGAVLVGKTTMPEFGINNYTSNSTLHGITRNPWNIKYTPGGSSGGSAVAVSAGLVPLALGTDLGGSISVPSAFCGVAGMKPSFGRVPRYPSDTVDLTAIGIMARSIKDLALAMTVISKPDIRDWSSLPYDCVEYADHLDLPMTKLKVAYHPDSGPTNKIAQWLYSQGAVVDVVDFGIDIEEALQIMWNITVPEAIEKWQGIPKDLWPVTSRQTQQQFAILCHSKIDLYHWISRRKKSIIKFGEIMQRYDVILGPASATSADEFLVDTTVPDLINSFLSKFSVLACVTKQPTITIPVGLNNNSMPEAVQIIGPMYGDALTLQIATAIGSAFPMSAPPPLYDTLK